MIRITSDYLKAGDIVFLKKFCNFALRKLLRPSVARKANINIRIIRNEDLAHGDDVLDLKEYGAWVIYDGAVDGKKRFSMVLNARRLNRNAKKPLYRNRKLIADLAHELVHIKQYLSNELFDYADGKARFKGEVFPLGKSDDDDLYFNSPWEIEAYGREYGLYKMFSKKCKQEQKEKLKK